MSRRRCFFQCTSKFSLFALPKENDTKNQWLKFIFPIVTQKYNPNNLYLCSLHFTEDCFLNRVQFNNGFSKRLVLKDGAVPTLSGQSGGSASPPVMVSASTMSQFESTGGSAFQIFPAVRHVACQTDPPERKSVSTQLIMETPKLKPPERKSVGTQLSMKTLQNRFRSTATQVRVSSRNCGVCTLGFPLDSPLLLLQPTIVKRPSKRPRLSLTDVEEGPSECSLSMVVCEPEGST